MASSSSYSISVVVTQYVATSESSSSDIPNESYYYEATPSGSCLITLSISPSTTSSEIPHLTTFQKMTLTQPVTNLSSSSSNSDIRETTLQYCFDKSKELVMIHRIQFTQSRIQVNLQIPVNEMILDVQVFHIFKEGPLLKSPIQSNLKELYLMRLLIFLALQNQLRQIKYNMMFTQTFPHLLNLFKQLQVSRGQFTNLILKERKDTREPLNLHLFWQNIKNNWLQYRKFGRYAPLFVVQPLAYRN